MAQPLSNKELVGMIQGSDEQRDAILNPVSNTDMFADTLTSGLANAVSNLYNAPRNTLEAGYNPARGIIPSALSILKDVIGDDETKSRTSKEITKRFNESDGESIIGKVFDASKGIVETDKSDPTSVLLGDIRDVETAEKRALQEKNLLRGQHTTGAGGEFLAELLLSAPTLPLGAMTHSNKLRALGTGYTPIKMAKAIGKDAFRNANLFSTTEFGLAKLYGGTDEEATAAGIMGKLMGAGGSLGVGYGRAIADGTKSTPLKSAQYKMATGQNLTEEEMGAMAGGGKPKEFEEAKKATEDIEFDVVSPVKERKPIPENEYVPTVKNPMKFKYFFDDAGRVYNDEASMLGPQGTSDQKASLALRKKENVTSAKEEVARRLQFYKNDEGLQKAYGQSQAKFKELDELPEKERTRLKNAFIREQYLSLSKDKGLSNSVRKEARGLFQKVKDVDLKKKDIPEPIKAKAEKRFENQEIVKTPSKLEAREKDLKTEYTMLSKSNKNNPDFEKASNDISEAKAEVLTKARADRLNVNKVKQKLNTAITRSGDKKGFDEANITPEQRAKYRDEIATIEDFQNRRADLKAHTEGKISDSEFRWREEQRILDKLSRGEANFKDMDELQAHGKSIKDELKAIGLDDSKVKGKLDKKPSGGIESAEKKLQREAREIANNDAKRVGLIDQIKSYRNSPKHRTKKGRLRLTEAQRKDVKEGILSNEEIADKKFPEGVTNAGLEEAIAKGKATASKKVTETRQKQLGIKEPLKKPDAIQFTDAVKDVSNSIGQIVSVLLGSSKLAGKTSLKKGSTEVRTDIGNKMEANGIKKPTTISEETGKPMTWKEVIKPIFMVKNYGQMKDNLAKTFAKTHKVSKAEADEFLTQYEKASDEVAPEFKAFSDTIYDIFNKSNKSEFSWKMPDGFEVKLKLSSTDKGTIKVGDKTYKFKVNTKDKDEFSRAIMPRMVQSVDAYIARQLNKEGFPMIHDAAIARVDDTARLEKVYTKIMQDLNDGNLLDSMMKDIGYEGKSLKIGDLTNKEIAEADKKLGTEHSPDKPEISKPRKFDVSKQSTQEEVMRDYMASGNYRQIPTNQMVDSLINEAGRNNTILKKAREGDDPFERQVALAMQSPTYNPKLAIDVPEGVNKKVWDETQESIFNEARAKVEYDPLLKDAVQGERVFFDKNRKPLNSRLKTYKEILDEELSALDDVMARQPKATRVKLRGSKGVKLKSQKLEDKSTIEKDVLRARALHDEAIADAKAKTNESHWKDDFTTLWKEQVDEGNAKLDEFNNLERIRNIKKAETDRTAEILYNKIKDLPSEKKKEFKRLVDSDYESIRNMDEATATKIWKDSKRLRDIVYKEINQGAKALGNSSEQVGAYLPNAHLIAKRYDLPPHVEPVIDQLISIKAMKDNNGWSVLKRYGNDDPDLKFVLDTMTEKRVVSQQQLFHSNPESYVKGYVSEVYRGNKKINEDGSISYDADAKYEQGVLGAERENNKVGTLFDGTPPKFKDLDSELTWMYQNRLKKTVDGNYRKVPAESVKLKAGKSNELEDILTETIRSTHEKIAERGLIEKTLADLSNESLIFSKTPKDNMVNLTDEQKMKLPYDLREELNYIDRDLTNKLLGRDEVRLYKGDNQNIKIADRLLSNLGTAFKQNVVLKNPASYLNSLLVNQTMALSAGIDPRKMYKYQVDAISDLKEMRKMLDIATEKKLTGEKLDKFLKAKLKDNQLYKFERAGLSTNRVEGVVGDDDLLSSMLADHVPSPIFKMARVMNLNQKTAGGKVTLRMFSNIDTMGRYMIAKGLIDKGVPINNAVKQANGLFGDMDKMVPSSIEMLDKYGFVPFLKWYTLTSPRLLKLAKDNPKKALAVGIGVYVLGQETDTNLSTVNPIEGMIDFLENAMPFEVIEKIEKKGLLDTMGGRAINTVIPKYGSIAYRNPFDLVWKLRKERIEAPKYESSVDYRGFVQQTIEGD